MPQSRLPSKSLFTLFYRLYANERKLVFEQNNGLKIFCDESEYTEFLRLLIVNDNIIAIHQHYSGKSRDATKTTICRARNNNDWIFERIKLVITK